MNGGLLESGHGMTDATRTTCLPDPVSPIHITIWFMDIASTISFRKSTIGNVSSSSSSAVLASLRLLLLDIVAARQESDSLTTQAQHVITTAQGHKTEGQKRRKQRQ